jgi:hypothetical protein
MKRHLIIPDAQVKPESRIEHIRWAGAAILEYKPDVVICLGDWWDLPSLNSHAEKGSAEVEGRRYHEDIAAGNVAFKILDSYFKKTRSKSWNPRKVFLEGNHENRANRVANNDPKWKGIIGSQNCQTLDWERHRFLKIVEIDGIKYCHYFPNPFSGKPIGGTIVNRLNAIGASFVQGHQQGFLYASKQYPDHVKHGLVAGRFYLEHESYRPDDVQSNEWNGIVALNDVRDGDYDLMPLRIDYLRRKYG